MVVEDGTIVENANSYVTADFADAYFAERGEASWAELSDEEKEFALTKATDFIDASFKWRGKRSTQEQPLKFPRVDLVDTDGYEVVGVPAAIKQAVCEAALMVKDGKELFLTKNENGAVTSETIGSLSFSYDNSKLKDDVSLYDSINLRLRGLVYDNKSRIISGKVERV